MSRFSVWSWWSAWRQRTNAKATRGVEPADMGTAFGLDAIAQADEMFGQPTPWGSSKPADDRARYIP